MMRHKIPELELRKELCRVAGKRRFVKTLLENSKLPSDDWRRRDFSYVNCAFRSIELLKDDRGEFYAKLKKCEDILDEIIDGSFGGRVEIIKNPRYFLEKEVVGEKQ